MTGKVTPEAKKAYRKAVKKTHPDYGGSAAEFRKVQAAWEALNRRSPTTDSHQRRPGSYTQPPPYTRPRPSPRERDQHQRAKEQARRARQQAWDSRPPRGSKKKDRPWPPPPGTVNRDEIPTWKCIAGPVVLVAIIACFIYPL